MHYIISYNNPSAHYIDIEIHINEVKDQTIELQLPSWRPGRYELGNFAKNIQKFEVFNANKIPLTHKKITKDRWLVTTNNQSKIVVKYNYYAYELNAGSTYLDEEQLYVNGINCLMYVENRLNENCTLELKIPKNYEVATGLNKTKSKNRFTAKNFHELVDCPFIASASLKTHTFEVNKTKFNLCFQGICQPDFKILEKDFKKFIAAQIKAFGNFPVKDYYFLFQITPYRTYHGVEHANSTVIAIGPSWDIFNKDGWYDELLGVSSHELYHTWNVKQIRPIEMFPYDYTKENYTYLGYLDEGVTTYMGDLFLLRSKVFTWQQYVKTFNQLLERHFNNHGSANLSVADSSFDTWLDGYVKGVPGRKSSIYVEGALCAFITDVFIMKHSKNKYNLDDVMKYLYEAYALKNKGVGEEDYIRTIEQFAGASYKKIYNNLLHGTADYLPYLKDACKYIGCKLNIKPAENYSEAYFGIKINANNAIELIHPSSEAYKKLSVEDVIIAINDIAVTNDINQWLDYFKEEKIKLLVNRKSKLLTVHLSKPTHLYYKKYTLSTLKNKKIKKCWSW